MPCGYDAPRAHLEALEHADALAGIGARRVVAVNASAYFSRPGPRLIDGLELLAHIFHPDRRPARPGRRRSLWSSQVTAMQSAEAPTGPAAECDVRAGARH